MATVTNTIQALLASLHDKMISQYPLTPEEQLLAAKAVDALSQHASLEQALVAVAEQHLQDATCAMEDSTQQMVNALAASTSSAQSAYEQVSAKAGELAQIPEIKTHIDQVPQVLQAPESRLGEPEFILDYYDNAAKHYYSRTTNYSPYHALSLVDYHTGCFYVYWDYANQTNTNQKATWIKLDADGEIETSQLNALSYDSDVQDALTLIRLGDGDVRLGWKESATNTFSVTEPMLFEKHISIVLDFWLLYQEKVTGAIYGVSQGKLQKLLHTGWSEVAEHAIASEADFIAWAEAQVLTPLHGLFTSTNTKTNTGSSSGGTGWGGNGLNLAIRRPQSYLELCFDGAEISDISYRTNQVLCRDRAEQTQGSTNTIVRSYKSRIRLPKQGGTYIASMANLIASPNYNGNNHHGQHFPPMLFASSPLHRAVFINEYWGYHGRTVDSIFFA